MANQNALTAAHIRYLLVLLRLTAANGHTRCVDLAAALELSPPSVHNMVDTMTALGLVKKGTRGAVSLTEYGSRTAERYQRYYHSAAALLRQGFPEIDVCLSRLQGPLSHGFGF